MAEHSLIFRDWGRRGVEFRGIGGDIVWHGNCMVVSVGDCAGRDAQVDWVGAEHSSQTGRNAPIEGAIAESSFCSFSRSNFRRPLTGHCVETAPSGSGLCRLRGVYRYVIQAPDGCGKRFSCYGLALGVLSSCLVNRVWVPTTVRVAEFVQDGGKEHRIRRLCEFHWIPCIG